jgi:hypothetical protein
MLSIHKVKPGDDITAASYNALIAACNAPSLSVAGGSELAIVDGVIASTAKVRRWLKLTSASGTGASRVYAWTAVERDAAGTWQDTALSGTTTNNPARDINSTTDLSSLPYYVRAVFEPDGPWFESQPVAAAGTQVYPVKAPSGGIAALSGTTPGSATCTMYTWNGTAFQATGSTLTVRNPYSSAVAASKLLWVADWQGATWVVSEAC